jgi:two-component system, cell cycle response regulator DivK
MPKILIVEDNTDTRDALHHYFTNAGYEVPTAVDGGEGLYMAKAEKPDLILTDIAMPKMNGIDMIKQIRSEKETAEIPILVFTAHTSCTTEEALEAGATHAFYKPFDFNELRKVVRERLGQNGDS